MVRKASLALVILSLFATGEAYLFGGNIFESYSRLKNELRGLSRLYSQ